MVYLDDCKGIYWAEIKCMERSSFYYMWLFVSWFYFYENSDVDLILIDG